MAAYDNLPWLDGSSQFLRAIIAGASQGDRLSRRGGGGGGSHYSPSPRMIRESTPELVAPIGPHLGGIAGSPVLIDPARENQPDKVSLPFDFNGRKMITNAAGQVVDYVEPVNTKTPFGGQQAGYYQIDPKTGKAVQIVPPTSNKSGADQKYQVPVMQTKNGAIRTIPMTPGELDSKWSQLPEFGKTNTISQLVRNLGRDKAVAQPAQTQPNGTRVRNRTTGETATWVNGQLVPDQAEGQTPIAEENPYAGMPGQQPGGGFSYFGPEVIPAR